MRFCMRAPRTRAMCTIGSHSTLPSKTEGIYPPADCDACMERASERGQHERAPSGRAALTALCQGARAANAETEGVLRLQTAMRVWDALLSEGAKILYRVALALLKTHEDRLMAQDNAGYVQREMKLASASMHDRDALMKVGDRPAGHELPPRLRRGPHPLSYFSLPSSEVGRPQAYSCGGFPKSLHFAPLGLVKMESMSFLFAQDLSAYPRNADPAMDNRARTACLSSQKMRYLSRSATLQRSRSCGRWPSTRWAACPWRA